MYVSASLYLRNSRSSQPLCRRPCSYLSSPSLWSHSPTDDSPTDKDELLPPQGAYKAEMTIFLAQSYTCTSTWPSRWQKEGSAVKLYVLGCGGHIYFCIFIYLYPCPVFYAHFPSSGQAGDGRQISPTPPPETLTCCSSGPAVFTWLFLRCCASLLLQHPLVIVYRLLC